MEVAARCLDDEGLLLLHTIGKNRLGEYGLGADCDF